MYFNTPNKRENYVDPSQTPGTTFAPSNTTYAPITHTPPSNNKKCDCDKSGMMNFFMMILIVGLVVLAFLSINDNIKVTPVSA